VRQKDIAEASGVSRPSLSRSVGRLVEAGLLDKAADGTLTPGKPA
jgi:DNA-binding MarR family transcriptional regulator